MRMKFFSLFAIGALLGAVFAHPTENEKRQSGCTVVTGRTGSVYPRLEVRQILNTKPNQWILFMLAMRRWLDTPQSDKLSYFQLAGIHGVPRANWNGVGSCKTCTDTDGYCTHDSVLFPSWHRAYMALFEQVFMQQVDAVVKTFPTSRQAAMAGAASTMRFPYWDWAAHPPTGFPTFSNVFSQKTVTVNGPNGYQTFNNPLFRYDFTDVSQMYYDPFRTWTVSYRYPNSNNYGAVSQTQKAADAIEALRPFQQSRLYKLFSECDDYFAFSSAASNGCSESLESLHNYIHNAVGGPSSSVSAGHMTYLSTAAFDPTFWLHHMNVDRIFAIWQPLHPSKYGASQTAVAKSWTIAQGDPQNATSPLTPFYKDSSCSKFWNTNDVRDTKTFGYTYPELLSANGNTGTLNSIVNKLYGPSATATAGSVKRTAIPELEHQNKRDILPYMLKNAQGKTYQYEAHLQTSRYALDGPYDVYLFLGSPQSNDTTTWMSDPNFAGTFGVFSKPGMSHVNVTTYGSVPLTQSLTTKLENGLLDSLSSFHATPYLARALSWRIVAGGVSVDPTAVPDFQVKVYYLTATEPTNPEELSVYGNLDLLRNVTQHKLGGYGNIPVGRRPPPYTIPPVSLADDDTVTSVVHSSTTVCPVSSTAATLTPTDASSSRVRTTITLRETTTICTETPSTCDSQATATA